MTPETPVHLAILDYLRVNLPHGWIIKHVPNKPRSAIQGGREKRMGAVAGWPDLMILGREYPKIIDEGGPRVWFIEVKAPTTGRVQKNQTEVHDKLKLLGFEVGIARSIDDARALCKSWELPIREVT
jgi:hypothetical protein